MYLDTKIKIFKICDSGESFYIAAENKESAFNYFVKELSCEDIDLNVLNINEIKKHEDINIKIEEESILYILMNRFKNNKRKKNNVNIWILLTYILAIKELQQIDNYVPFIISGTVY